MESACLFVCCEYLFTICWTITSTF